VLLGANGAGKSSLLSVLAGISAPDLGVVEMSTSSKAFLMPEPAAFYPQLTVQEQLMFVAGLFDIEGAAQLVDELMSHWQLQAVKKKLTKQLALGYRQRLSLAQLALSDAEVMLLDEPMNGMDPEIMTVFKQQVMQWKINKSLVVATHIMPEAEAMADWVVVMFQGRIIHSAAYHHDISFSEIYQQSIAALSLSSASVS
jgi:ABC-type multidrug transport system ATPase subunit